jgi:hypothetical protein
LLSLIALLACAAAPVVRAASPASQPAEPPASIELRVEVACLSAYGAKTRDDAVEKLVARGEPAEKLLLARLPSVRHDPEVQRQ